MAMKLSLNEFLGVEEEFIPSATVMTEKMTIDTLAEVHSRIKELGIKQKELADELGVTPSALSKLLSNGSNLQYSTVAKLAEALACDIVSPKLVPLETESISESIGTTSSQMVSHTKVHVSLSGSSLEDEYEKLCTQKKSNSVLDSHYEVSKHSEKFDLVGTLGASR